MRCPNPSCGEENPASATHCEVCGAALSGAVKRRTSLEPAPALPGAASPGGFPGGGFPGLNPGKRRETKFEALPDLPPPAAAPGPPVFQPGGPPGPPVYQGAPVYQGTPAPPPAAPGASPGPQAYPSAAAYSVSGAHAPTHPAPPAGPGAAPGGAQGAGQGGSAYPPAAPYPSAFGQAPPIVAPAPTPGAARPFEATSVSPVDALLRGLAPGAGGARAPVEERPSFPNMTGGRMAATTLAVAPDLGGPSPVRAALFEYRGKEHAGSIHVLRGGRNVIGRDAAVCDVVLDDDRASKQHAFLFIRGDEASFIDVSSNGSTVDGRLVFGTEAKLQQHSTIDIGATRFVFVIVPERLIDGPR